MNTQRVQTNYGEGIVIDSFENAFDDNYPLNRRIILYKVQLVSDNDVIMCEPDEVIFLDDSTMNEGMSAMTLICSDSKQPFEPGQAK